MKPTNKNGNPWRAMILVTAVGVDIVVCMLTGLWIAKAISNEAENQSVWIGIGMVGGLFVGIFSAILLIRYYSGGSNG